MRSTIYRHELKFICNLLDLKVIESKISNIMHLDTHVDETGGYLIRSIYFDDYSHSCYYENAEGIDPREKYRIRIYDCSNQMIFLEKKKKISGMTGKRSCKISSECCKKMLNGENLLDCFGDHRLLDEWIIDRNQKCITPAVLIEYFRKPYVYHLGNVRITFDMNISASRKTDNPFEKNIPKIALLPTSYHILEVKYDDYLPDVLNKALDIKHLQQMTFSKFYLGCKTIGGNLYELY